MLKNRQSHAGVNSLQKKIVKQIPPTMAALRREQPSRVVTLRVNPSLPTPASWGWTKSEDGLCMHVSQSGQHYLKLPKPAINCYHASVRMVVWHNCKCKKAELEYLALCACDGECLKTCTLSRMY